MSRVVEEKRSAIAPSAPSVPSALRLAIGKDGLGIELAAPVAFACIDVVELVVRLPRVKFPFDVSGGVTRFRHKRGELERVALELDARRLATWAAPRLRGLLGTGRCEVVVDARRYGATFTLSDAASALAFEIGLVPAQDDLVLAVHGARGANLGAPATTLALRAMEAMLRGVAAREGSRFVIARAAARLAQHLLPDSGVRAPSGDDVRLARAGASDGVVLLAFARSDGERPGDLGLPSDAASAARAAEAASLARQGDDARLAGDVALARHHDLFALERAPRHPELARRVAELDALAGGRAESAIAALREASPPPLAGTLLGDLLAESGDAPSAIAALAASAERDPSNAVAALAFARAADLSADAHDALAWLDAAVARAPRLARVRWERAGRRVRAGRLADARADLQALEALAETPRERFDVFMRAAAIYRAAALGEPAAELYERALLHRPDDAEALAGLGVALASEGRAARGAAVLARAVDLASAARTPTAWMELELAKVLGERLGDRPAAVARLRAVRDDAAEAILARGLEGRFRAEIGDVAGASLAFARLRERAAGEPSALPLLLEAARFEASRADFHAAQLHLAAALAIAPRDPEVERLYRLACAELAPPVPAAGPPAPPPVIEDDGAAELRVENLTRTLQGDPTNDAVIDELVILLSRLGRSMDLLALLSARLEDAPEHRRAELLPRHRETLARLEDEARAAGRDAEADLFKMAREAS